MHDPEYFSIGGGVSVGYSSKQGGVQGIFLLILLNGSHLPIKVKSFRFALLYIKGAYQKLLTWEDVYKYVKMLTRV